MNYPRSFMIDLANMVGGDRSVSAYAKKCASDELEKLKRDFEKKEARSHLDAIEVESEIIETKDS